MCVLRIGLMHLSYCIYFYYLLLFITHVLLLAKLGDLLMYLSLSVIRSILAELLYVCQTVGVCIRKWLPNLVSIDNTALYVSFSKIGISFKI